MLDSYLKNAFRIFWKEKSLNLIKIICLAVGLACFIYTYCIVSYWQASDGQANAAARTYVITQTISPRNLKSGLQFSAPRTPEHLAKYLREDFPGLESVFRADGLGDHAVSGGGQKATLKLGVADPELLTVFEIPVRRAGTANIIPRSSEAVITDSAAQRLLGTADALGKRLTIDGVLDVTVAGVIERFPRPSHIGSASSPLSFDVLISWDDLARLRAATNAKGQQQPESENWLGRRSLTYAVLQDNSPDTTRSFISGLAAFGKNRVPAEQWAVATVDFGAVQVGKLRIAALDAELLTNIGAAPTVTTLVLGLGALILLVAVLNYINLATAQVLRRTKEIGFRKSIGATPGQIVSLYFAEAALHTLFALLLAIIIIVLLSPALDALLDIEVLQEFLTAKALAFLGGVFVAVTLLAGAYPAVRMARIVPARAQQMQTAPGGSLSTLLVAVQFGTASLLLLTIIVMSMQERNLRQIGMTGRQDPVIILNSPSETGRIGIDVLRSEFMKSRFVRSVSAVNRQPWTSGTSLILLSRTPEAALAPQEAFEHAVSYDYFEATATRILTGRSFNKSLGDEERPFNLERLRPDQPVPLVIDAEFSRKLGFRAPKDAVDQLLYVDLTAFRKSTQSFRIIGVAENKPLHFSAGGVTANTYGLAPNLPITLIRIDRENIPVAIKDIDSTWTRLAPNTPINRRFSDDLFEENYRVYSRASLLISVLVITALAIGIAGLVAMSVHMVEGRTHEIGVRKTLGAPARTILGMLLLDISKPIALASLCIWPLGYLLVTAYLNVFMQRIALSVWPFLLSFIITTVIGVLAISAQVIRAARLNPVTVLRYE